MSSALAVANYFIDLAKESEKDISPLQLIKLVYLAHGFTLAIFNKSALDPRYDRVEAWKFGPVIPSVYQTFKWYQNSAIQEKGFVFRSTNENDVASIYVPVLGDDEEYVKRTCRFVWRRYGNWKPKDLVELLHTPSSPWHIVYVSGENKEIPDTLTKVYYRLFLRKITNGKFQTLS